MQQSKGDNKCRQMTAGWFYLQVYLSSNTAFNALTAIKAFVIIPAWRIAMAKLLGDLLPLLRQVLRYG